MYVHLIQSYSAKNTTLTPWFAAMPLRAYKYLICMAAFPLKISAV